jgi:hypothetical protein
VLAEALARSAASSSSPMSRTARSRPRSRIARSTASAAGAGHRVAHVGVAVLEEARARRDRVVDLRRCSSAPIGW